MTSPLRGLSLRARVLSVNCSLFVTLTLARLAQWRRAFRRDPCPARSRFAHSGFGRFACLLMIAVMFVQFALFPPEVSHAAVDGVSATAINSAQGAHFWWHSSGLAARYERLRNEYLPHIGATAQQRGWDGKGAPRNSRPAPQAVATQQEREQKIARYSFPTTWEAATGRLCDCNING